MTRFRLTAGGSTLVACAVAFLVGAAGPAGGARAARPTGTIVFVSNRSGNYEIYSTRADGSRLGQLTRNGGWNEAPVFSPDGRRLTFLRGRDRYSLNLWLMNADGSGQRRLSKYSSWPAWSPDSHRLAYSVPGRSRTNRYPIVIVSLDGGGRVVIRGDNFSPSWSPDGTRLAFWRAAGERTALVVVGSDGRGLRVLRRNVPLGGGRILWSPAGQIAFATAHGTYVVRPDGHGFHRLVRGGINGFGWSPDGTRLAFVDVRGRLYVASASGRGARNITPKGAGWVDLPAWSPDSRWIVVQSRPKDAVYRDLLVVAPDGSAARRATARVPHPWGSEHRQPIWQPRGASAARL
jgi:TolB protein